MCEKKRLMQKYNKLRNNSILQLLFSNIANK